jgi:RNA polymerase sigma-70 factor (ECF subfamily)
MDGHLPFAALQQRMRAGDEAAWAEFYRRYEPFLRRVARRWLTPGLRRQADSSDVVHSVFRITMQSLGGVTIETEAKMRAWLSAVLRHRISRLGRRSAGPGGGALESLQEADGNPVALPSPAEMAEQAEALHRLKDALDRLPHGEREAVLLREFDGLSYAEIAGRLERPTAEAARKLYERAKARVRTWLSGPSPRDGKP